MIVRRFTLVASKELTATGELMSGFRYTADHY